MRFEPLEVQSILANRFTRTIHYNKLIQNSDSLRHCTHLSPTFPEVNKCEMPLFLYNYMCQMSVVYNFNTPQYSFGLVPNRVLTIDSKMFSSGLKWSEISILCKIRHLWYYLYPFTALKHFKTYNSHTFLLWMLILDIPTEESRCDLIPAVWCPAKIRDPLFSWNLNIHG